MMVLSAIYVPGLLVFEKALRDVRHFEETDSDALAGARERLVHARQAWEAREFRTAIVDASAAADLAQTVFGPFRDRAARVMLDDLRRSAIDPAVDVDREDAVHAIETARSLIDEMPSAVDEPG